MVEDTRRKNVTWGLPSTQSGPTSVEAASLAVLMDIREELQILNHVFKCPNFLVIPRTLQKIAANTAKPRKRPK